MQDDIRIQRGQLLAVLLANAVLWVAVLFLTGDAKLAGAAAIALISIGSLASVQRSKRL